MYMKRWKVDRKGTVIALSIMLAIAIAALIFVSITFLQKKSSDQHYNTPEFSSWHDEYIYYRTETYSKASTSNDDAISYLRHIIDNQDDVDKKIDIQLFYAEFCSVIDRTNEAISYLENLDINNVKNEQQQNYYILLYSLYLEKGDVAKAEGIKKNIKEDNLTVEDLAPNPEDL